MRICLFGQGPLCEAVHAALSAQGHTLIGPYASPQPTEVLRSSQASVGLSCGYRHKLRPEEWECFPDGILNLHTGYLPWNKGAYPNVWPILDGSPGGVTLHRVDAGIDTGPILVQQQVTVEPWDTAHTLYEKLLAAGVRMTVAYVGMVATSPLHHGRFPSGWAQPEGGSRHFKRDLLADVGLPIEAMGGGASVITALRAATFPGYGLRYRQDGKLLEATITITEVTE